MKSKSAKNQMRVLLAEPCWENYGGYFRAIGMAKNLARKGVEVDLVIPQIKGEAKVEEKILEKNLRIIKATNLNYNLSDRLKRYRFMKQLIKRNHYDIIHIFTIVQPEMVLLLWYCFLTRRKRVLDWDDYWQDSPMYKNSGRLTKWYITFAERIIARLSRNMCVASEFLRDRTREIGIKHIVKIINGVDHEQFRLYKPEEALKILKLDPKLKYVISFGNTYFHERSYLILKTFGELLKKNSDVRFISNLDFRELFNDYPKLKTLDKKIFDNIIVVGFIPPEKLGLYLAVSECIIFLSGDEDFEKACFPIRIGSYLNGERVIATNDVETEWNMIVRSHDALLIGKDYKDLANKVSELISDSKLKDEMEVRARKAKKAMRWDVIIEDLIKFYSQV